ncbi:NAD(P)-binding protein [Plenodomus tracheiphilus IPT5]|uniref:NAD(P)-binding protein n=1 Tax=Plenodomus tracheiphilus IPT5 TaxID=1408161 RepID=A0A6A7AP56_9PLEO|nr:NAD(P)-binding protein [Plenodomus tracheiphilus IPT5]
MSFSPDKDIVDLSGKVILVTGGNAGLGFESVLQLTKHNPQTIIMASRSQDKAEAAMKEIQITVPKANIKFLQIDISSFASIKKAAALVIEQFDRLDILLNNAGFVAASTGLTEDGYELHFGTNHMGPALLTRLLLPLLDKTSKLPDSDVRVVQLASEARQIAPKGGILFDQLKTPCEKIAGRALYGQSKLANIYFIKALATRYSSIKCVSLHPGAVKTNIMESTVKKYSYIAWLLRIIINLVTVDVHTGALGQLWASAGRASEIKSGAYYIPLKKEITTSELVNNTELAEKLWNWTEKEFTDRGL